MEASGSTHPPSVLVPLSGGFLSWPASLPQPPPSPPTSSPLRGGHSPQDREELWLLRHSFPFRDEKLRLRKGKAPPKVVHPLTGQEECP